MSIRDNAYALCRVISAAPARKPLADLIRSFNSRDIGYYGHQQFAQILGYLIVEQNRSQLSQNPMMSVDISSLPENEHYILAGAHAQIAELNRRCVEPLLSAFPERALSVDPYSQFGYIPPKENIQVELLSPTEFDSLAKSFHTHPQIEIAIQSGRMLPEQLAGASIILQEVLKTEDEYDVPRKLDN